MFEQEGIDGQQDMVGLHIGATALLADVAAHAGIKKNYPAVADAAKNTANVQIRNMGTVVGNIANAADLLIPPIQNRLEGVIPHLPRIEKAHLNGQAALLGGVVLTFRKVTEYAKVYSS